MTTGSTLTAFSVAMADPTDPTTSVAPSSMILFLEVSSSKSLPSLSSPSEEDSPGSKLNRPHIIRALDYKALSPNDQEARDLETAAALTQAQASIAADSASDGGETASLSDAGYETASLRSGSPSLSLSARDYRFENGRRYHRFREGRYNFPNDESEQEREDLKHSMMVNLCQTLLFAPLPGNPEEILDLGTGTGTWAIDSEFILIILPQIRAGWAPDDY